MTTEEVKIEAADAVPGRYYYDTNGDVIMCVTQTNDSLQYLYRIKPQGIGHNHAAVEWCYHEECCKFTPTPPECDSIDWEPTEETK